MNNFNDKIVEPYLYSCNNIVIEVNKEFIDLIGFTMDEVLGRSLIDIGNMLKINSQMLLNNISSNYSGYIFTKLIQAIEVNISLFQGRKDNEKKYTFVEKPNSRLNDKLIFEEQTFIDNLSGVAVYSVPDLVLLKTNQKYLEFMYSPFNKEENSVGKPIRKIISEFEGSKSEAIWKNVLETKKTSYTKEFEFKRVQRDMTYWDFIKIPIFQDGKLKYLFETSINVTERVLQNKNLKMQSKIIEQQRKQLEERNTQLTSIIENLSEGVIIANNKGRIMMVNSEAKKLLYQCDKAIYLNDTHKSTKAFDMKGNDILLEDFPGARALRGESVKNAKMFISHPGKQFYAEISSVPIYNAFKYLTMVIICFHDINETIEQSRIIEEQNKQSVAIIENIADSISIFDSKGQYILFNKAARESFYPSYINFSNIGDIYKQCEFYDSDGKRISSENIPAHRVMRGEIIKNMRISKKFPQRTLQRDVSGTPIYDSEGKFSLGVLCSRDMTDYFQHEEEIKNRYEFMNRMIDTFDLPVIRLSCPSLKIKDINQKAFNIIKSMRTNIESMSQVKGNMIEDVFRMFKTTEYYQSITEALEQKKTKYLNKQKHSVDGKEIYWNVIFEPMFEIDGEIDEILILIVDVTTEIMSNIFMEKALKLQGEFLVNISHELKTPLNVICATTQLFTMYCNNGTFDDNKNSIIKYIESIKQNSYRLSKLINNIVDLSKIEAGFLKLKLSNNNIVEVVEEIVMSVTNFTEIKGLNIIFDTDVEEKIIACDPEMIERIVLNLISNAIKFSEVGDEIFVDVKDKNEFVEISVEDNGIGIEGKYLDMIFDRFKQVDKSLSRNAEGTGIGLSLVKSIVELHGGNIVVSSEFGKGSKFTVILPSKEVSYEDSIYTSKVKNEQQDIQVELSDVLS